MKKWMKTVAILVALLLLTTMATACQEDEQATDISAIAGSNEDWGEEDSGKQEAPEEEEIEAVKPGGDVEGNKAPSNSEKPAPEEPNQNEQTEPPAPADPKEDEFVFPIDPIKPGHYKNPLLAESRSVNNSVKPSFNLDTTGLIKNAIKLKDLKGKTITFMYPGREPSFAYKDGNGSYVTEWDWFNKLKEAYNLQVTYVRSREDRLLQKNLTYMNAGKPLDVIYTYEGGFPKLLNLSQPLDPYLNLQNIDTSPGINFKLMLKIRWGGTYRCMMPVGDVNVLWYNQTLAGQLKLADPQTLWRQGEWDWNGFKSFVTSVPATANGKTLYAYQQAAADMMNAWPLTNSMAPVWIDPKSRDASLINNWTDERTLSAWEFISDTVQKIQFGCSYSKLYEDGTLMMADTEVLQPFRKDNVYSKDVRYRWVPFPSAPNEMGKCIALGGGKAMMLPKKTAVKTNSLYAAKFMELWATRFTEAMQDYFATADCIGMNHSEWYEYYDFVSNNTCFSLQMNEWDMLSEEGIAAKDAWFKALTDPSLNIRTESKAFEEYVRQAIDLCLAYDA